MAHPRELTEISPTGQRMAYVFGWVDSCGYSTGLQCGYPAIAHDANGIVKSHAFIPTKNYIPLSEAVFDQGHWREVKMNQQAVLGDWLDPAPSPTVGSYRAETGKGRLDISGHEWFACDPYPTWYRKENGKIITRD